MAVEQIRPLTGADFEAVVALDARITGQPRRGYFEKRLASALRHPRLHFQLGVTGPAGLQGFLLARRADGEYGRRDPSVVLETIGVDPAAQRAGRGRRMLAGLGELAASRGARVLCTQADWRDHSLLRLFDRAGFRLAPRQVLLTQMIENLAALHVERLETEVAAGDLELLRFLHAFGFLPAQRLPFERAL